MTARDSRLGMLGVLARREFWNPHAYNALAEAGFAFRDVVRARYYVTEQGYAALITPVLGETFGEIRPAATMVISQLIDPRMKVEIEVTAYKP